MSQKIQCKYLTSEKLTPDNLNFKRYKCDDMSNIKIIL